MAKLVKRASGKKHTVSHDDDEPLVTSVPDDVHVDANEEALREGALVIEALAKMTPNLMGTAHGLALIHAAKKWMLQYHWVKA